MHYNITRGARDIVGKSLEENKALPAFDSANFKRYAHAAIEIFGPNRCMFGSNFPVDKLYVSYSDLFKQWQTVVACYNREESKYLTADTATHFYHLY